MREFPSSIYTRPRARLRPTYRKVSWLDVLRAERKRDAIQARLNKVMRDGFAYGTGISLTTVDVTAFYRGSSE